MTLLKYLSLPTFFFLIGCETLSQVTTRAEIIGQYVSTDSKFERTSALTLSIDSTFLYFYMLGGCQGNIKGRWMLTNATITLQPDINADSVLHHLPDLNNIGWNITSKGLQPNATINNGCFKENAFHKKVK